MKKLLVTAIVVLMASPAFAAVQNVKVSGDITSTWINRNNFDLGTTLGSEGTAGSTAYAPVGLKKQNVFITQTRVRIDADLSDNVSTTVGLINERAWDKESNATSGDTTVDLYLASVTMRELLYSPLTVTVGRQIFNYGNGLIIGDRGLNNQNTGTLQFVAQDLSMRKTYDGIKAVLDYKPLTIDLIYFKNYQNIVTGNPIADKSSSDVYGINANYQLSDPWSTVMETYMFTRVNGNVTMVAGVPTSTSNRGDTLFVPGLRASTNPVKGLNVQAELAWQLGNHPVLSGTAQEAEKRHAMAAQLLASYSLPVYQKYKPSVNASYTYVSGDKNGTQNYGVDQANSAKRFTAWDPFNENQGGGTIYNTLFPLSNMHIIALGVSANPLEDVTAAFTWSSLWNAAPYGTNNALALFQPDGGTVAITPATKHDGRGLGNEYDVNLAYNYTEDVTFGVSLGWYVPTGSAFSSANNSLASQALADVAVKF